eukprot:TRINITY_DN741_c0_g1_i5.p1 TRINITY_DN741_c0_g1~~TRINITY_DN741_c0_g1_i5.p1  ORF type:complete len:320 (-),score=51.35 TRINITY_DN741_c0_g1_i5:7-966(-)
MKRIMKNIIKEQQEKRKIDILQHCKHAIMNLTSIEFDIKSAVTYLEMAKLKKELRTTASKDTLCKIISGEAKIQQSNICKVMMSLIYLYDQVLPELEENYIDDHVVKYMRDNLKNLKRWYTGGEKMRNQIDEFLNKYDVVPAAQREQKQMKQSSSTQKRNSSSRTENQMKQSQMKQSSSTQRTQKQMKQSSSTQRTQNQMKQSSSTQRTQKQMKQSSSTQKSSSRTEKQTNFSDTNRGPYGKAIFYHKTKASEQKPTIEDPGSRKKSTRKRKRDQENDDRPPRIKKLRTENTSDRVQCAHALACPNCGINLTINILKDS